MQQKLKEMLLVLRPSPDGLLGSNEIDSILNKLGYDYLVTPDSIKRLKELLDKESTGKFK